MAATALSTPLTELLEIRHPIVQAPIGSATSAALAAAVSNAGGLGFLAVSWCEPQEIRTLIRETRRLTDRPFGINVVLEWPQHERLRTCLEEHAGIVSFFWGDASPYLPLLKEAGAKAIVSVGSPHEARKAVAAGADLIVAQGFEAGGHVRGEVASMALVPAIVDTVHPVPVLAAGGIADGRGVAAALALGAAGVWMGTRFLASEEANVDPVYKESILRAGVEDTLLSRLFDGGWPDAPHRTLRNATVEAWLRAGSPPVGERPGEGDEVAVRPNGRTVQRYEDVIPQPGMKGDLEALALYAGESAGLVKSVLPAGKIVESLVAETLAVLARLDRLRGRERMGSG